MLSSFCRQIFERVANLGAYSLEDGDIGPLVVFGRDPLPGGTILRENLQILLDI